MFPEIANASGGILQGGAIQKTKLVPPVPVRRIGRLPGPCQIGDITGLKFLSVIVMKQIAECILNAQDIAGVGRVQLKNTPLFIKSNTHVRSLLSVGIIPCFIDFRMDFLSLSSVRSERRYDGGLARQLFLSDFLQNPPHSFRSIRPLWCVGAGNCVAICPEALG